MGFKLHKRTLGILMFVSGLCEEDGLSALRARVRIVSICCVWISNDTKFALEWPKTEVCWFKLDGPYEFVKCLHIVYGRRSNT